MTTQEFTKLKEDIDRAKAEKIRAEGAMENITKSWQENYGCKTVDEIKALLEKETTELQSLQASHDKYMAEIEKELP